MEDDLQLVEAVLIRLRPAAPSRELRARVDRELAPGHRRRTMNLPWLWVAALPAAAAVALLLSAVLRQSGPRRLDTEKPGTGPAASREAADTVEILKPVTAENVLYSARDEGLVTLDDGTSARRERLNFVDTITWKNPRTNTSLTWTVPREEVRLVPVSFQ